MARVYGKNSGYLKKKDKEKNFNVTVKFSDAPEEEKRKLLYKCFDILSTEFFGEYRFKKEINNIIFFYKLGILTGKLRGYENDEDLLKLVKYE